MLVVLGLLQMLPVLRSTLPLLLLPLLFLLPLRPLLLLLPLLFLLLLGPLLLLLPLLVLLLRPLPSPSQPLLPCLAGARSAGATGCRPLLPAATRGTHTLSEQG